jgi:hypothetical protein
MFIRKWPAVLTVLLGAAPALMSADLPQTHSLRNRFGMSVSVAPNQGTYSIAYKGRPWLGLGAVSVLAENRWHRSARNLFSDAGHGLLPVPDARTGSNRDVLGSYEFIDLSWKVTG